jgi:flagellar assembly factor FliW
MHAQQIQDQDRVEVRTRFGTLPVNKENLLDFPEGLPGFEDLHRFILIEDEANPGVLLLQSLDDPEIHLPVTSPEWFRVNYEIELSDEETALLQLEQPQDAAILVTLANSEDHPEGLHANFQGPIILNTARHIGMQKPMYNAIGSLLIHAH